MLKKRTSVLFVSSNGKDSKTIQIPTIFLLNWKKYLIITISVFGILGVTIGLFIFDYTSKYYTTMYKEKLARANQIKNAIDIEKAKKSFKSINESMQKINLFMTQRGLKTMKLENAGGPEEFDIADLNSIAAFYAKDIAKMEDLVKNTPMGKPFFGEITSRFGYRYNPFGGSAIEGHKGIDFKGDYGAPIKSTAEGKVTFAGTKGGYGNCVIIQHKNNLKTLYGHLSAISVKNGQLVKLGDVIGKLGSTGRSTGPHLHYEVMKNDVRINPEIFITQ
ncbi:MAG: M23 family metallopeptidase [Niabella sp.]